MCFLVCCDFIFKASESLKFLIVLCDTIFSQSKFPIYWCKFSSKNLSVTSTFLVGKMMLQPYETMFDNLDQIITAQKMKFPLKDLVSVTKSVEEVLIENFFICAVNLEAALKKRFFMTGIYLLKVNNRNIRPKCETCSKFKMKPP